MFRPELFKDPQIKYPLLSPHLNFSDYINESKHIIANTRQDVDQNKSKISDMNAPFEMHPSAPTRTGVLLIHGLLDSCFVMKEIATHLHSQGFFVRGVLLPGHGTVPGALLNIDYHAWLDSVRYGIHSLSKEVDTIILIGYSTGALTAIYETLQGNIPIAGIVLLAPAFTIKSPFAGFANWPPRLGMPWMGQLPENDYVKYSSVTFQSIYQVYQLGNEIKKLLQTKKLVCPTLTIISEQDEIVSSKACLAYFSQDIHSQSQLLLYTNSAKPFEDSRIVVRNSYYPEQRILNFSHICLTSSKNNPHYGKNGDFPEASHIETDRESYFYALNTLDTKIYRKLYQMKLIKHPRKRLTFNPDFSFMMKKIKDFCHPDKTTKPSILLK